MSSNTEVRKLRKKSIIEMIELLFSFFFIIIASISVAVVVIVEKFYAIIKKCCW